VHSLRHVGLAAPGEHVQRLAGRCRLLGLRDDGLRGRGRAAEPGARRHRGRALVADRLELGDALEPGGVRLQLREILAVHVDDGVDVRHAAILVTPFRRRARNPDDVDLVLVQQRVDQRLRVVLLLRRQLQIRADEDSRLAI
jgi:hypothetical protein